MFIFSQKGWGGIAALALLISFFSFQSFTPENSECTCAQVTNASVSQQPDSVVTLGWDAVPGATAYEAWYTRNDGYTGSKKSTSATSVDFSGLAPGTYDFYVVTVCGSDASEIIILEDIIIV